MSLFPKAGDFIDLSAAQVVGERANRVRLAKEDSFHINGFFPDKIQQVISVYYDDMIRSLVAALRDAFAGTPNIPKFTRPIPMVLSGGTALPGTRSFREGYYWAIPLGLKSSGGEPAVPPPLKARWCAL